MDLLFFIGGYYDIELISNDMKRFLNICAYHQVNLYNIAISNLKNGDKSLTCKIRRDDFKNIEKIVQKSNGYIQNKNLRGLPYWYQRFVSLKWFFIGAFAALFLLIYCSSLLWNINVLGNHFYSEDMIIRFLNKENIKCGIFLENISTLELSDKIRKAFPDIVWCTVSLDGCNMIIQIKENEMNIIKHKDVLNNEPIPLISDRNGIIYDMVIRQGVSDKKIGDEVKKGDILINGEVPIKNDFDEIVTYDHVVADGDVYLLYKIYYYKQIDRNRDQNIVIFSNVCPVFHIFGYRFVINGFVKHMPNQQKFTYLHYFKLTDNWSLPMQVGKEISQITKKSNSFLSENKVKSLLEDDFYQFCSDLEKKGVQIYENDVKIDVSDYYGIMSGSVSVIERISNDHTQYMEE